MKVQEVRLDRIRPNAWNPNVMSEAKLAGLRQNIKRVGLVQPILVREVDADDKGRDLEIVDGEQRWTAAIDEGVTKGHVVLVTLEELDAKMQTIAMNELRGEMDPATTGALYKEQIDAGASAEDLATYTGHTADEIDGLVKLADFDWEKYRGQQPDGGGGKQKQEDDDWATFTIRLPAEVHTLAAAELDRVKALMGTDKDNVAFEAIIANSLNAAEGVYEGATGGSEG